MATTVSIVDPTTCDGLNIASWTFTGTETGDTHKTPGIYSDRSVQMTGTFGNAVVLEGSNDGTNYYTLTDGLGNSISMTSSGIKQIGEVTRFVRPRATGAVTSVVITLVQR
jgi:hypothetical protein